ncbi:MAG: polyphosphate polymerase domain-containing protein [Clostridia bacterium]|nr:polyphosphate polymerase domain-containing protein [Clostridia bacterium]
MTILNTAAPFIANFERYEKKYQMTAFQAAALKPVLESYMKPDQYPTSTNCSLYLDTPDHLLVRRSLQHPDYKEKLRLRSYGTPDDNGIVFLEIKKKTGGIVYKRRISMGAQEAMDYLLNGEKPEKQGQIFREIDWMMQRYHLIPSIMVNYDRISYTEMTPSPDSLRITKDRKNL